MSHEYENLITMPTINQIYRGCRVNRYRSDRVGKILGDSPFKSGTVLSVIPKLMIKKPNSGNRKGVKVKLSNGKTVIAYIPGKGHNLVSHSKVLVRSGRVQDCPGVRFKIVRGKYDCSSVDRKTSRSKY